MIDVGNFRSAIHADQIYTNVQWVRPRERAGWDRLKAKYVTLYRLSEYDASSRNQRDTFKPEKAGDHGPTAEMRLSFVDDDICRKHSVQFYIDEDLLVLEPRRDREMANARSSQ